MAISILAGPISKSVMEPENRLPVFALGIIPFVPVGLPSRKAMEILRAEHERKHVHHAFFKDAMRHRFYAIYNCCSCCCGAMQA